MKRDEMQRRTAFQKERIRRIFGAVSDEINFRCETYPTHRDGVCVVPVKAMMQILNLPGADDDVDNYQMPLAGAGGRRRSRRTR